MYMYMYLLYLYLLIFDRSSSVVVRRHPSSVVILHLQIKGRMHSCNKSSKTSSHNPRNPLGKMYLGKCCINHGLTSLEVPRTFVWGLVYFGINNCPECRITLSVIIEINGTKKYKWSREGWGWGVSKGVCWTGGAWTCCHVLGYK